MTFKFTAAILDIHFLISAIHTCVEIYILYLLNVNIGTI